YHSCLFFFSCLSDHRHLHSFPTRRSSDLGEVDICEVGGQMQYVSVYLRYFGAKMIRPAVQPLGAVSDPDDGRLAGADGSDTGCGDRKSTRLNSSHVAISYAVFCLKKKNKQ